MTHPLNGPRLKIRRAEREINALRLVEETFMREAKHKIVRAEFNSKTGKYVYRAVIDSVPDPECGVRVGEIAHNLRSALDGLVWQLALLKTKTPAGNTQFPIFLRGRTVRKRKNGNLLPHFQREGRGMIRDLCTKHQAMIEWLQPYKRSPRPKENLLYLLNEVNNTDKHRLVQVLGAKLASFSYGWNDPTRQGSPIVHLNRQSRILKDRAKVLEAPSDVHVNSQIIPQIAFGDSCHAVRGRHVESLLRPMSKLVSDIIERFAPEFEE